MGCVVRKRGPRTLPCSMIHCKPRCAPMQHVVLWEGLTLSTGCTAIFRGAGEMVGRGVAAALAGCVLSAAVAVSAWAQADRFPSRAITLVVSYPAGGLSDLPARALAPGLQTRLGVPVVVEDGVGGSGSVGGGF